MAALSLAYDGHRATITLTQPEVRNAFSDEVIADITAAFLEVGARPDVRVVVLPLAFVDLDTPLDTLLDLGPLVIVPSNSVPTDLSKALAASSPETVSTGRVSPSAFLLTAYHLPSVPWTHSFIIA